MDSTNERQHGRSLWRGVLFATLTTPLAFIMLPLLMTPRIASFDRLLQGIVFIAAVTTPIALLATTLLGLPVILLLRSLKWLNWATVCVGAALTGMFTNILVVDLMTGRLPSVGQTLLMAFIGLVAGVAFCLGAKVAYPATAKALRGEIG